MPEITPVHLSVKDACTRHNISRSYLYRLLGEGKVCARKNGKRLLVIVASIDAHFESLPFAKIKPAAGVQPIEAPPAQPFCRHGRLPKQPASPSTPINTAPPVQPAEAPPPSGEQ